MTWTHEVFTLGMPHLAPCELSEVELLKHLGNSQWEALAAVLGVPSPQIVNDQGERLYASFLSVDLCLGRRPLQTFVEGARLHVRHRAQLFASRFAEGILCFDDEDIPQSELDALMDPSARKASSRPYATMTNAFIARTGTNLRLTTFAPVGAPTEGEGVTHTMPLGIREHEQVQRSGQLPEEALPREVHVPSETVGPVGYPILPEGDLNGAGLLYFARYVAMMNYAERLFLTRRLFRPVSAKLARRLTTEHRRILYFANADESDTVDVYVRAFASAETDDAQSDALHETPLRFRFFFELYRRSDGILMACSSVRKLLRIPRRQKALMAEASRLAVRLGLG